MISQQLTIATILLPVCFPYQRNWTNYLEEVREEPDSSGGSRADEEAAAVGTGWTGTGKPLQIGVGYTVRYICDGQSLASPGRWTPSIRRYPSSDMWTSVADLVRRFSEHFGTTQLLMDLALGRVEKWSWRAQSRDRLISVITRTELEQSKWWQKRASDRFQIPCPSPQSFWGARHAVG